MANRRRKDLTDIEKAREFGRQSLEDAETGKLQRAQSGNEVRGIATIPYLDGSMGGIIPNNTPSVAIDAPIIPQNRDISWEAEQRARALEANRQMLDYYHDVMREENASRNAQRRREAGQAEVLGSRKAPGEKTLTAKAQNEIDGMDREIKSLERSFTGDAGVDEVTNSRINDLKRQKESVRNAGRSKNDYMVTREDYTDKMQDPEFANDLSKLTKILYNQRRAGGIATVNATSEKLTGKKYADYVADLSKKYDLSEAELRDMALTMHSDDRQGYVDERQERARQFGEAHPVLGSIASLGETLGDSVEGYYNNLAGMITGDDRRLSNAFKSTKEGMREGVKENLGTEGRIARLEKYNPNGINDRKIAALKNRDNPEAAKVAYDLLMSLGDLGVGVATGNAPLTLAGTTANDAMLGAIDRGQSTRKAALYGTGAGVVDYITNTIGLDYAKGRGMEKIAESGIEGLKQYLASMGVSAGAEAGENLIQNLTQTVLDEVINKDRSETQTNFRNRIANGESEEEAFKNTLIDKGKEILMEIASGAVMGAGMYGGTYALNGLKGRSGDIPGIDPNDPPNPPGGGTPEIPHMAPADLARQNEIDVNEKVDNVNQAVDDTNNLAEQIPENPIDTTREYLNKEKGIFKTPNNIQDIIATNEQSVRSMPAVTTVNKGIFKGEGSIIDKVDRFFASRNNVARNDVLGDVVLNRRGIKDSLSHNRLTSRKADAFAAVPDVIERGKIVDYQPNWKGRGYDTALIVAPTRSVDADGNVEDFITGVIVRRDASSQRFYTHDAVSINKNEPSFKTGTSSDGLRTRGDGSSSIYSLLQKIADDKGNFNDIDASMDQANDSTKSAISPELSNEAERYFTNMEQGYDGSAEWWENTINKAKDWISNGDETERPLRVSVASEYLGRMEKLAKESEQLINAGGRPIWSMAQPLQQLDVVEAQINSVLENVPLEDEKIVLEAENIRKALNKYRTALGGYSSEAVNRARLDLINATKRFDTKAKSIGLEGYNNEFSRRGFTYDSVNSNGVGSPQTLWNDIQTQRAANERILEGRTPEDTLGNLLSEKPDGDGPDIPPADGGDDGGVPPTTPPTTPPDDGGNTPVELDQSANGDARERGMSQHVRGEDTPMRVANVSDEVRADFKDNPDMYHQLKNADTQALADDIYNSGDTPVSINGRVYDGNVETKFRSLLNEMNPAALPLGDKIAQDYSAAGNHDMAAQIYLDMGAKLTDSGRFSQAAVLTMMKNDPLTALAYFQKELVGLNKAGAEKYGKKWKDFVLTEEEKALFDNIKPGDTEAIKKAYDTIGARIEKEYPVTFWEKVLEFRRVAMLFNTRTIARNTLANPPTAGLRFVADRIEALGQNIAHLINPEIDVNQSVRAASVADRNLATQIFNSDKVQAMLKDDTGRLSEIPKVGDYAKSKQIFKGGFISDWINKWTNDGITKLNAKMGKQNSSSLGELTRNSAYGALQITDSPFVRENFISRLGSYIRAKNIKSMDQVPDEAIRMAYEEAMKATYKDNSWLVGVVRGFKDNIAKAGNYIHPGLGDVASQAIIPYVQAPANIGARVMDYSAVGATKGIGKIISGATSNNPKLIQKGIEEFSKGATGSLMAALGYLLYKSGVITGTYSQDDDQKAFEKQNGFREFALRYKINGKTKYDTINWMQPMVDTLMPGVLLAQAIENSDAYDSDILRYFGYEGSSLGKGIGVAREAARKNINYFFDSTPLKNLADLLGGGYGKTDIAGNLWQNTVEDFASGLVPAQVNALAKTVDPIQRQTYDPDNSFATFLNSIGAKLPGISDNLAPKYDTWGEPLTYGNSKAEAGFGKLLYPGEHTSDTSDEIDNEINRLFDATGNSGVFPLVAPTKVGDKKLSAKEESDYQENMGKRSRKIAEDFINSDIYQTLDDKSRSDALEALYKVSKEITERDLFGNGVSSTNKTAVDAYDSGKEEGLLNFLEGKAIASSAGISASSNVAKSINEAVASGRTDLAEQYAQNAQTLSEYGLVPAAQDVYNTRVSGEDGLMPGLDVNSYGQLFQQVDTSGDGKIQQGEVVEKLPELIAKYAGKDASIQKMQDTAAKLYQSLYTDYKDNSQVPEVQSDGTIKMVSSTQEKEETEPEKPQEITTIDPAYQPSNVNNAQYNTIDDVWTSMKDAGFSTSGATPYWNQASQYGTTPQQFAEYFNGIDGALGQPNGGLSMDEWEAYLNNNEYDAEEDEDIIKKLYNTRWRKPKYDGKKWSI